MKTVNFLEAINSGRRFKPVDYSNDVQVYRSRLNTLETISYLQEKISNNFEWELVDYNNYAFRIIENLYTFKHNTTLKDTKDDLEEIYNLINNNLDWIEEYCKNE